MNAAVDACDACLRRSWLLARLSGHIELAWAARRPLPVVLALSDAELIAALGGDRSEVVRGEWERFDARRARGRCTEVGVAARCRCAATYPTTLADLPDAPAVLYALAARSGWERLLMDDAVAVVGARRATPYGLEQARGIARGVAAAGVTVVSGMALGVDAAAHAGALEAEGATVAILAGPPERAYPASKRRLHARIAETGVVLSEQPPGAGVRRWAFPARNRIIAALARATLVVEAGERSGSLITATLALDLGRDVAAVPGLVTAPLARGTNGLIADGARLVRDARDVLELLFGAEVAAEATAGRAARAPLPSDLERLLEQVAGGRNTVAALIGDGVGIDAVLAGLAQLELRGLVRRTAGGRYALLS